MIYLIIDFEWAKPFQPEQAKLAKALHSAVQDKDWIEEVLAASGGIGAGAGYVWIFKLENYAALDRLLHDREDAVCQAYLAFFSQMSAVSEKIREAVIFR